jgi:oxepin-CoA hydrolase/3-oxo-5,6-dehydrosuberyl-CoA semialdehyde dehydrogenase
MQIVESYLCGQWVSGQGARRTLRDATTAEVVAELGSPVFSGSDVLAHARNFGSRALQEMTFHERAGLLKGLAKFLSERKQELFTLSTSTGATKADSILDVDGGLGVLFSYASRAIKELPNGRVYIEGAPESLSKGGEFMGQHVCTSRRGACVQINAYNFPVWGMLEKLAPALLAGSAAIVKPATPTCFVTCHLVHQILESGLLPEGVVQLICGSLGDLLDHVRSDDSVAFTGSAMTARKIRRVPAMIDNSTRFSAETDSLNACLLGPEAKPGSREFELFISEVAREMTLKAGQRCTAIRRAIVPKQYLAAVSEAIHSAFAAIVIGDPRRDDVQMGPVVGLEQRDDVLNQVALLRTETELLTGDPLGAVPAGADGSQGAFIPPTLLLCRRPDRATAVHSVEAFGPVCTLMPYDDVSDAVAIANRGGGSLVCSIFTADLQSARAMTADLSSQHGRILVVNESASRFSTGHGSPLPGLVHGGPGRAGGGEELGGLRAVMHHMQRTAVQGSPEMVRALGDA